MGIVAGMRSTLLRASHYKYWYEATKSCSSCGYCECGLHVPKYHKCLENYYLHKTVYVNPDFGSGNSGELF
jgi:hypothetical protein